MAQHIINREDYAHPERVYKGLIYAPDAETPQEELEKDNIYVWRNVASLGAAKAKETKLCWCCGWNALNELGSSYGSRLQIFHTRGNVGIWEVGNRWLIRDQPNDMTLGNDFMTQEFLRNRHTNIPLLDDMQLLSKPTDDVQIVLMSRAQGQTLHEVWDTLSPQQKSGYKDQLAAAIKSWREFTSPVPCKADGSLLNDCIIGFCGNPTAPTCKTIGRTPEEWLDSIEPELRVGLSNIHATNDPVFIEEKLKGLRKNFPKSEPYVLTHGDLNFTNIMVKDDKIEAIIDWEYSGFFPWWAERWLSLIRGNPRNDELFDPLWADIGFEMDEDTFQREVINNIAPVIRAWDAIWPNVEHSNLQARWLRPPFCECQPYGGEFKVAHIGHPPEHKLKVKKAD